MSAARVFVAEPNRGKARNAGVEAATGELVAFVDDDVSCRRGFLAAHAARASGRTFARSFGSDPQRPGRTIERPKPSAANYSGAFSVHVQRLDPAAAFERPAASTRASTSTAGRIRNSGCACDEAGSSAPLPGMPTLYHIKPPEYRNASTWILGKTRERARMARAAFAESSGLAHQVGDGRVRRQSVRARSSRFRLGRCPSIRRWRATSARRKRCVRWRARNCWTANTPANSGARCGTPAISILPRKRVLLVRLDGIGDALTCVPLVAALKEAGHELGRGPFDAQS